MQQSTRSTWSSAWYMVNVMLAITIIPILETRRLRLHEVTQSKLQQKVEPGLKPRIRNLTPKPYSEWV